MLESDRRRPFKPEMPLLVGELPFTHVREFHKYRFVFAAGNFYLPGIFLAVFGTAQYFLIGTGIAWLKRRK